MASQRKCEKINIEIFELKKNDKNYVHTTTKRISVAIVEQKKQLFVLHTTMQIERYNNRCLGMYLSDDGD